MTRTSEKRPAVGGSRLFGMRDRVDSTYGGSRAVDSGVKMESQTITALKNQWMTGEVYIACLDLDFEWAKSDVEDFLRMWEMGISVEYMAKHFGREESEVVLLIIDQCYKGAIQPRKSGLDGSSLEKG
jgi:hypothetical protein